MVLSLGAYAHARAASEAASEEEAIQLKRHPALKVRAPAERNRLFDLTQVQKRLFAVGAYGLLLVSDDDGKSWRQIPLPVDLTLTSIYFRNERQGWIGGHEALLMGTNDGGATWSVIHHDAQSSPILKIWYSERHGGFAIGGNSTMFRTRDGKRWERRDLVADNDDGFGPHLFDIVSLGGDSLLIAAEQGYLFRSRDGGERWSIIESPYEGTLFGALSFPDREGAAIVYGMLGHAFLTADSGESWSAIETHTEQFLFSDSLTPSGESWLAGTDGAVLRLSWNEQGGIDARPVKMPVGRQTIMSMLRLPASGRWVVATTQGAVQIQQP